MKPKFHFVMKTKQSINFDDRWSRIFVYHCMIKIISCKYYYRLYEYFSFHIRLLQYVVIQLNVKRLTLTCEEINPYNLDRGYVYQFTDPVMLHFCKDIYSFWTFIGAKEHQIRHLLLKTERHILYRILSVLISK